MRRAAVAICSGAAVAAALAAVDAGASAPTPTLTASRTLVTYGKSVTLSGHAGSAGKVTLEANPFPFRHGFHTIATAKVSSSGDYTFRARPSHANRYRVLVTHNRQTTRSPGISVYVEDRVLLLTCNLCTTANSAGSHTLTVNYVAEAPPGKVGVRGPVYFYYGLVEGTSPPPTIDLVKHVELHRSGHTLSYTITHTIDFPASAFQFRVAACFKAAEASDGVGFPGHHHCGDGSLTRQQYLGYLG